MPMNPMKMLKLELLRIVDSIDVGNSNLEEEDLLEVLEMINKATNTQNKLSKYQACKYLNISRATFDNYVRAGKLPEGKKEQGFTEKFWVKEDLIKFKTNK